MNIYTAQFFFVKVATWPAGKQTIRAKNKPRKKKPNEIIKRKAGNANIKGQSCNIKIYSIVVFL